MRRGHMEGWGKRTARSSQMLRLLLLLATLGRLWAAGGVASEGGAENEMLVARLELLAGQGNRQGVMSALQEVEGWWEGEELRPRLSANLSERAAQALLSTERPFEAIDVLAAAEGQSWSAVLLQADVLVSLGQWDEAAELYRSVWSGADHGATTREAARRLGVLLFAEGRDMSGAWEAWRASGAMEEEEEEGSGLLWLCERELRFLSRLFPHGLPPPPPSCSTGDECCRRSPWMDAMYSHLLVMTFTDELGAFTSSLTHLHHALRLCPSPELELRGALATPIVFPSAQAMAEHRHRLMHGEVLSGAKARARARMMQARPSGALPPPERAPHLHFSVTPAHMFIGYQGLEDQEATLRVAQAHLQLYPHLLHTHINSTSGTSGGRVRVGFVSSFLWSHSVGRLLHQVIARLDRTRFHVHILHVGQAPPDDDPVAKALSNRSSTDDVVAVLPSHDLQAAASLVWRQGLDVLVFPEVGMDTHTYLLACRRLARVQAVFWGHPVSQGLPSLDYFLTSDLFETTTPSTDRYHEQRLLMDTTGTFFLRPPPSTTTNNSSNGRASLGLSDGSHVYVICQTLMKFHPGMDHSLLAPLLQRDPAGVVVITYNPSQRMWRHELERRFRQSLGVSACRRVLFVPSLAKPAFYSLLQSADVVLDTYPFGGGVTALEALAAGTVVVTVPSRQTVPQLAAGMYRRMGLHDMVSHSAEHAVDRALRLADDKAFRQQELDRLRSRLPLLYEDDGVVDEWQRTLQRLAEKQ